MKRSLRAFTFTALTLAASCADELRPPVADAGADQANVVVGTLVQLDGTKSSDPALLPLDYAWSFVEVPAGSHAVLEAATTSKPFFTADRSGTYVARLIVADGQTTSAPDTVVVKAGSCGANLPVIDAIAATPEKPNGGELVALSATVTHADEADDCKLTRSESYAWKFTKIPAGSGAQLLAADTATPSFTSDVVGDYQVSLTVTDDLGHPSAAKLFDLPVGTCGTAVPEVTAIDASPAAPGVGATVQLTATVEDADTMDPCLGTESYTYAWQIQALPAGSAAMLNLDSAESPSFQPDVAGKYVVAVTVTDAKGHASAKQTFEVVIAECGGNVPVVSAITATPAMPAANQLVALSAQVDDADTSMECGLSETFTYDWKLVGVPAGSLAKLNSASVASPSFTPDVTGDYLVALGVTDAQKQQSIVKQEKITTSTCGQTPPTALIAEVFPDVVTAAADVVAPRAPVSGAIQLSAAASTDADNTNGCGPQTLSYAWSFVELPPGSTATLNNTTLVNPSFTADVIGKYVVQLLVTDSTKLTSKAATFTVTADPALNVAVPPTFTIATLAGGAAQGFSTPKGLTLDAGGAIYVAMSGTNRIRKLDKGSVTTFATGGLLVGPNDIAYESSTNQFYVTGTSNLVKLTSTGVQSACRSGGYRGIEAVTITGNNRRLVTANRDQSRLELVRTDCTVATTQNFQTSIGNAVDDPWGVTLLASGGIDHLFEVDRARNDLRRNSGGTSTTNGGSNAVVSQSILDEPRDVVVTPATCAAPKLVFAEQSTGQLVLVSNPLTGTVASTVIASGFTKPVGLVFEDSTHLLVTDETLNALFRITGDFCTL
jgi:hypothetical protein